MKEAIHSQDLNANFNQHAGLGASFMLSNCAQTARDLR
jgi:hypothetical protein